MWGRVWPSASVPDRCADMGSSRFYPRYFPQSLRDHFEIVFCDLRQWVLG